MKGKALMMFLLFSTILLVHASIVSADETIDGSRKIDGNLTVNGNLTVKGDLIVNGRIISTGEAETNSPADIFVELWNLDQRHNGLSVTLRGSQGAWEDENADIRLDEQQQSLNPNNDNAPLPLLVIHNSSKLNSPTYQTVKELFDNYNADEVDDEDELGSNHTEDSELGNFLDAVMATEVMNGCLIHINEQDLHSGRQDITAAEFRELLKHQWFELYTNHFSTPKDNCSGFEHVFVGDHNGSTIGGHHFWWKYFRDQEAGTADSLGHKYNGPQGDRYRWLATFRMRWIPEAGTTLINPEQKGFFVGSSPELMLAYGTLGLLMEKKNDGAHPVVTLDGGRFDLTVHASTLRGSGDPDERRGDQIRSVFPILRAVAATGPGLDITVADALATAVGERIQVTGVITDSHNEEFGLKLADTVDSPRFLAVKLPESFRPEFNPQNNAAAQGATVVIHGRRGMYTGIDGIVDVTHVESVE